MADAEFECPGCGQKLPGLASKFRDLRQKLREAEAEVEHLGGKFVASRIRSHFHRDECRWAKYILQSKSARNLLEFSSHQEAIDAGYRPCKTCCA